MTTRNIPHNSDLHKKLMAMVSERIALAKTAHGVQVPKWSTAEDQVVAYVPETDSDAIRRTKSENGEPQYTTISIPYSFALVMAAHTYWTSVFFARSPVHQFTGRHGEGEMQVQAVEAMIDYQVSTKMMLPYYLWIYDAAKFGVGILGSYWEKEVVQWTELQPEAGPDGKPTGKTAQISYQTNAYTGNCAYNISPFDFMHDPRVPIHQFQKGEFTVVKRSVSYNEILKMTEQGHYIRENVAQLKGRHPAKEGSEDSTSSLTRPDKQNGIMQDMKFTGLSGEKPSRVELYEFCVELVQKDWGLGESKYPEKWFMTLTQDETLFLGIRPLGAIHGQFPYDVLEPETEAYASFSRGIPEIMKPVQQTMDWLLNSHFYNVRAALNNQFVVDPSRIRLNDVLNGNQPGFVFRMKPAGYGQDIRTMITQMPVQDVTRAHMADMNEMFNIGERVLGVNDAMMGMVAGGGRKTATEVRTGTGFGVNRLKTCAEYMSAMGFGPHATKLVQTSQQYYDMQMKMRIVGDYAMLAGPQFMMVDPMSIAGQYDFVHVDGTMPIDRMAQATLWKELLLSFRNLPQLMAEYDVAKMFAYTAQLAGLKNVRQFRLQPGSPEQLQAQAQAGNVIPIRPGQGTGMPGMPNMATQTGVNAMARAPGGGGGY